MRSCLNVINQREEGMRVGGWVHRNVHGEVVTGFVKEIRDNDFELIVTEPKELFGQKKSLHKNNLGVLEPELNFDDRAEICELLMYLLINNTLDHNDQQTFMELTTEMKWIKVIKH